MACLLRFKAMEEDKNKHAANQINIELSEEVFDANTISALLYGIQNIPSTHASTQRYLRAVHKQMLQSKQPFNIVNISNMFSPVELRIFSNFLVDLFGLLFNIYYHLLCNIQHS